MMQIIQQTDEEKLEMYMKLSKEEIIKLLLANQNLVEQLISRPQVVPVEPCRPYPGDWPFPQNPIVQTNPHPYTRGDPNIKVWYDFQYTATECTYRS